MRGCAICSQFRVSEFCLAVSGILGDGDQIQPTIMA